MTEVKNRYIPMYSYYILLPVTRSWLLRLELLFNSNQRQVYGWPTTVQQKVIKIGDNFSTPFKTKQKHFWTAKVSPWVSKPLSVNLELDIRKRSVFKNLFLKKEFNLNITLSFYHIAAQKYGNSANRKTCNCLLKIIIICLLLLYRTWSSAII